ncbi:hypothetical protein F4861DRAFT_328595 [Xylaria intraflava]|nr:hypothetical protein F4861DRAFT_328595 [Xylaria intraflava]
MNGKRNSYLPTYAQVTDARHIAWQLPGPQPEQALALQDQHSPVSAPLDGTEGAQVGPVSRRRRPSSILMCRVCYWHEVPLGWFRRMLGCVPVAYLSTKQILLDNFSLYCYGIYDVPRPEGPMPRRLTHSRGQHVFNAAGKSRGQHVFNAASKYFTRPASIQRGQQVYSSPAFDIYLVKDDDQETRYPVYPGASWPEPAWSGRLFSETS